MRKSTKNVEPMKSPSVLGSLAAGEEWLYLILAGLRDPSLHALVGGRLQPELFPPEMLQIKQAIDELQEGRKNGRLLPMEAIRLHLSGQRSKTLGEVLKRFSQVEIPSERVVLKGLRGVIQREGSRALAQEMLSQIDLGREKIDPEIFRERLDLLCFDFEMDRGTTTDLAKAPVSYHEVIEEGRVSTGLPTVDLSMGGGLGKGEIGIIATPPGGGKTAFLVSQGVRALLRGMYVVHISLEIHRLLVLERYDQALSGLPWNALRKRPGAIRSARKKVFDAEGSLSIFDLTSETISVGYIRSMLIRLNRRKPLGLVIVDYPALLTRDRHPDQRFGEIGNLVRKLRMVASKVEVPMWAAAQAKRETITSDRWGRESIAEDITIVNTCDTMLCLNQTLLEKEEKRGRMLLDKTRRASTNPFVPVLVDFDAVSFQEVQP